MSPCRQEPQPVYFPSFHGGAPGFGAAVGVGGGAGATAATGAGAGAGVTTSALCSTGAAEGSNTFAITTGCEPAGVSAGAAAVVPAEVAATGAADSAEFSLVDPLAESRAGSAADRDDAGVSPGAVVRATGGRAALADPARDWRGAEECRSAACPSNWSAADRVRAYPAE